ncbi:heavy metal translocating P-type ATPase [Streptomyces sp. NPDC049954]|uniref:heavy metal translocating P-type ATPase n=1 Tax=Streptomyces sp. NPDC049954 TaxID=3155779 RepID=UPI00341A43C2
MDEQHARGPRPHGDAHGDHAQHGGAGGRRGQGTDGDRSGQGGHRGHRGHGDHVAMFRRLFWTMLVLAVPVTLFSPMFADLLGYHLPSGAWVGWVSPVLGTVLFLWGGRPFLTGAVSELRGRSPGMMTLIALAITVAFVSSLCASLGLVGDDLDFWWELALLVVIMLLGHWLEMKSLAASRGALQSLAALLPDTAERLGADGRPRPVPPAELRVGDTVLVRPGARVPADGEVTGGAAAVDESMITGESVPVHRGEGERVVAGTVATDDVLRVRVTAVGEDTALAGIQRLVAEAQNSTSRSQVLADRAAGWLFWYALAAAAVTVTVWLALGRPEDALTRTITVLVIACPHALGLAIPLVVALATEKAARGGVLVTDRRALEAMRLVDTVLFDKTGTLTKGEPAVTGIATAGAGAAAGRTAGEEHLLALAAAVESESQHPLARAVVAAARARGLRPPTATGLDSAGGTGVSGRVDGRTVEVGGPALLARRHLRPLAEARGWEERGATVLHLVADGTVRGALALADEVRPESREAVGALHRRGLSVGMLTGDAEPVARAVGTALDVDEVVAGVRPDGKGAQVARLQERGRTVAMVGDGVNDAPALARADVGLAIGAGTDVAIASAGIVLAGDDPRTVLSVIDLSVATYRTMRQNLAWAAGYNILAVPLAAGVLAPVGFTLPMEAGALLMSASTVVVALNAQLLRRLDLTPWRRA